MLHIARYKAALRFVDQQLYSDALVLLRDAIALGPPNATMHVAAAICLAELGAEDEAAFELRTALILDSSVDTAIDADPRISHLA